ncbi:hypothetical protein PoB_002764400 [Plakobranchus ocellatus]|uniref:Uncharacterized protein n=1 Tax=Plakobranchus ocellatus TaxID=259542 RepID=A0AAV4A4K1_9GAST|nr:hypothetical protein PoB_002764400 [Plakobranchus ocellatus]
MDAMDQLAHAFIVKRKTKRWSTVVLFNIIDLNACRQCQDHNLYIWQVKLPEDKFLMMIKSGYTRTSNSATLHGAKECVVRPLDDTTVTIEPAPDDDDDVLNAESGGSSGRAVGYQPSKRSKFLFPVRAKSDFHCSSVSTSTKLVARSLKTLRK